MIWLYYNTTLEAKEKVREKSEDLHKIDMNSMRDTQDTAPDLSIALNAAGVSSYRRLIRIKSMSDDAWMPRGRTLIADISLTASLDRTKKGSHMSRFIECVDEQLASDGVSAEDLAARLAVLAAVKQGACRSEVRISAEYFDTSAVDGSLRFIARAVSNGRSARSLIGMSVESFSVCPCAQEMAGSTAMSVLMQAGHNKKDAESILSLITMPSHSQRGESTVMIDGESGVSLDNLINIARSSSSAAIAEKLKRPEELEVVLKGHASPMFAEDSVREIFRLIRNECGGLPKDTFVFASRENYESIHSHTAYASVCGLYAHLLSSPYYDAGHRRYFSADQWLYEFFEDDGAR